jgi:ribonuclease J
MGQRRLVTPQNNEPGASASRGQGQNNHQRSNNQRSSNTVLAKTTTRRGEAQRASRRTSDTVNARANQHVIDIPVNKSIYNGYNGKQFTLLDQKRQRPSNRPCLRVIPIGGVGEMGIGKNMTALEYGDDIIVIDMGFLFPGGDYPGINYIIPDTTYLEENKHKIRAHVFTHGHLDHIGAFRHIVHKIPAPVYATRFTVGMLKKNLEESTSGYEPDYIEMNPESHEQLKLSDNFSVEMIRVNHSIPDSAAVVIRTPVGVVIGTGDWRFEENPVDGKKFDLARMTEIASKEGILLLMNESTNCESAGTHTHSELDIKMSFGQVLDKYPNSRVIASCFSSQLHRIQLFLEEAKNHDRKVAFAGSSIIQNLEVALRAGIIKIPGNVVVKMDDIVKLPDGKVTIICTGSQGEFNAVLNRMATGAHKQVKIKNSDVIVFSSNAIPGNEKYVVRTVDGLMREGSDVIQNNKSHLTGVGPLHLSGHGYYDDHVKLITSLNPTYYLPNHGEFHMLVHNAELAEKEAGIRRENIFVCDAGDVVEFYHDGSAKKNGRVTNNGGVMFDDSGAEVSEVVLRDRIHMSNEGIFVVVLTVMKGTGRLMTSPDIISRGFIYLRDSEELINLIRQYLKQKASRLLSGRKVDLDVAKKEIRDEITHILYDQTRRTPIVIPVINEMNISGGGQSGQNPRNGQNRQQSRNNQQPRQNSSPNDHNNPQNTQPQVVKPHLS